MTWTVVKVTSAIASVMLRSAVGGRKIGTSSPCGRSASLGGGRSTAVIRSSEGGALSFRRGWFRPVNADRADAGEKSGVVRDQDEHEDAADQREDAATEAAAAGALDQIENERGGDFEETLPAAGNELGAARERRADDEQQPHHDEHHEH